MSNISVIVPVYNVEPYIHCCVDSILSQTYKDFELILVDDGSHDNCGFICDEYAKQDNRVVVIHQQNGGLSAARNAGIDWAFANSNSEWITFIDSDDWVHEKYLDILLEICENKDVDIGSCSFLRTDKTTENEVLNESVFYISAEEAWTNYRKAESYACGRLYKKDLFQNIRYPLGKLYEDSFTTYKILFGSRKLLAYTDAALYYYFINPNSITESTWNVKKLDAIDAHEEQLAYFKREGYREAWKLTINIYIDCLAKCAKQLSFIRNKRKLFATRWKLRKELLIHSRILDVDRKERKFYFSSAYPILTGMFKWIKKRINNFLEIIGLNK